VCGSNKKAKDEEYKMKFKLRVKITGRLKTLIASMLSPVLIGFVPIYTVPPPVTTPYEKGGICRRKRRKSSPDFNAKLT